MCDISASRLTDVVDRYDGAGHVDSAFLSLCREEYHHNGFDRSS